jgi:hypothetical protein
MDESPFSVLAGVTLRDPESVPVIAPITVYDRWLLLTNVPRTRNMTDAEALDYAAGLGFFPEQWGAR